MYKEFFKSLISISGYRQNYNINFEYFFFKMVKTFYTYFLLNFDNK